MIKKLASRFMIIMFAIFVLIFGIRKTGVLNFSKIPDSANYPTFTKGDVVFFTNLKSIERYNFIIFESPLYFSLHTFRVIGMGGDTLMIKEGIVYINSKIVDGNLNLAHNFIISKEMYFDLKNKGIKIETLNIMWGGVIPDSVYINTFDKNARNLNFFPSRVISKEDFIDPSIKQIYGQDWNGDFFGPIIIPKNKFFVMGDNRDDALDSRYIGFIDKNDVVGVVINY